MQNFLNVTKRNLLTGVLAAGAGAATIAGMAREANSQLLESGVDAKSVLAKIKKGGALEVGFAQLPLWFYKDAKTGELKGIYKELVELLAKDLEMTVNWHEVTFANATVALRSGDYDLFGSSATYTVPRATVCNYVGPLWSKGSLAIIRKADADKFQSAADLNNPDVTIAVNGGSSDEQRMPRLFPKAKFIAVTGQYSMAAEPVRAGRANACIVGDSEAYALAKRNPDWAAIIDSSKPFDKRPNTWMIRYGDVAWKNFLDTWCGYITANGEVQRLYDKYASEIL
ncbi:transporter substrate-binding domain-containing protein [Bradyrhizobium sp. Ash2021]|uniref:substrate-binding periplasmic protein n=1 Tax=Bradyrhizobium sp. Ash2021 TaxID=2954771 RepID=UPI0028156A68|nr:transporter substrate-binding domain-containing protein [Bradyrhizobium sp. Ash2021]WMT79608.1 transporter substrate-binding domain-containing protein [Bradyrhizobium sp. Ash2021]